MKSIKFIVLSIALLGANAGFAFDPGMSNATIMNPAMGNIGVTPAHDMQMIKDLKLRYDIYNDVQDRKQERIRELDEPQLTEPAMKRIFNRQPAQQNVQFVEENGQVKIQNIQ